MAEIISEWENEARYPRKHEAEHALTITPQTYDEVCLICEVGRVEPLHLRHELFAKMLAVLPHCIVLAGVEKNRQPVVRLDPLHQGSCTG